MFDKNVPDGQTLYQHVFQQIKIAVSRGVKVIFLDNIMALTNGPHVKDKLAEQIRVAMELVSFTHANDFHLGLIGHTSKSNDGLTGALEQENLVDTILTFYRMNQIDKDLCQLV